MKSFSPKSTVFLAVLALVSSLRPAAGQMGGQMGGPGGMGGRPSQMNQPGNEIQSTPRADKPEAAAQKAYDAGMKSLNKAKAFAATAAANAQNSDKRDNALAKQNDNYGRALDQFTEALRNKGDMYEAWNNVGFVHLQLGAYNEAVDDYNHTLQMKPDLPEAIEHRAEAYVHVDRLDEAKSAYMDLFNHEPKLAEQLMVVMQQWLADHRIEANGMRASDVDAFSKWVEVRDGIAKQTASLPP